MVRPIFNYITFSNGKYSIKKKDFSPPVKKIERKLYVDDIQFGCRDFIPLEVVLKEINIDIKELFVKQGCIWILKDNKNFEKELEEYELKNKKYNEEREYMVKYNREVGNKSLQAIINKKQETISLLVKQIEDLQEQFKQEVNED